MADQQIQSDALSGLAVEGGDFASLLQKEFKPKSEEARDEVSRAVQTLAQQALSQTQLINADVLKSIEAIIDKIAEQAKKPKRAQIGSQAGRAGWLVNGAMIVLCFLWLLPTLGLLVEVPQQHPSRDEAQRHVDEEDPRPAGVVTDPAAQDRAEDWRHNHRHRP